MTGRARELVKRLRGSFDYDPGDMQDALHEAADFIEQSLTPPEGDTVSEGVVELVRDYVYDCTADEFGHGWTLSAEQTAHVIRLAALQSRVSPQAVEAETYRQMHEDAKELGYPSILEALEDLERLKSSPQAVSGIGTNETSRVAHEKTKALRELVTSRVSPQAGMREALEDKARLDWLQSESDDLRCFSIPTGGDDADIGWRVVGHYQGRPCERIIGEVRHDSLRDAIDEAREAVKQHGAYSDKFAALSTVPIPMSEDK